MDARAGCGCEVEPIDVRIMVIDRILQFLFEEQGPDGVGRADFDLFVDMARRYGWKVDDFAVLPEALRAVVTATRWATDQARDAALAGIAGPMALMLASTLRGTRPGPAVLDAATKWIVSVLNVKLILRSTIESNLIPPRILGVSLNTLWKAGMRDNDFIHELQILSRPQQHATDHPDDVTGAYAGSGRMKAAQILRSESLEAAARLMEGDAALTAALQQHRPPRRAVTMFTSLQTEALRRLIEAIDAGEPLDSQVIQSAPTGGRAVRLWMKSLTGRVDDEQMSAVLRQSDPHE